MDALVEAIQDVVVAEPETEVQPDPTQPDDATIETPANPANQHSLDRAHPAQRRPEDDRQWNSAKSEPSWRSACMK